MKKLSFITVLCLVFVLLFGTSVFAAAPSASLSASSTSVGAGKTVTVTVKVSNCSSTSLGIIPSYDTGAFELTSGEWLVSGAAMSDFSDGCAVIAYANKYNFSGNVFKFVLKAKTNAKISKYTVKCEVQAEGYSAVNPSLSLSVACVTHSFGGWTVTKEATCTKKGSQSRTCSVCGKVETKEIAAPGHKVDKYEVTKEATCTENGIKTGICSVCGEKIEQKIKAKGHSYDKGVVTKEATKSETGVLKKTCSVCGKTVEETIAKKSFEKTTKTVSEPESSEPELSEPESVDSEPSAEDVDADVDSQALGVFVPLWLIIVAGAVIVAEGIAIIVVAVMKKKK